jgi:hypothetical protein
VAGVGVGSVAVAKGAAAMAGADSAGVVRAVVLVGV